MPKGLRKIDFLIVGQGLAGSLLAIELIKAGKSVLVIDEESENTSSRKAGGIYNPITGRQMVKTWLADAIFPTISPYYSDLENLLGEKFHFPMEIYRPFFSPEELNDWEGRASDPDFRPFVKVIHRTSIGLPGFADPYGGLSLNHSGYVNLPILIDTARKWLINKGMYRNEVFSEEKLEQTGSEFHYTSFSADQVIYCQGPKAVESKFWSYLPFKLVKGEVLDLKLNLVTDKLLSRGIFILPKEGLFRVGSNYDHHDLSYEPSESARLEILDKMKRIYSGTFEILNQTAGIRPATFDRRPFIGSHPQIPGIGIFNGFGTKGVSLVPFFVTQYVNYLLRGGQLLTEADIKRVS